MSSMLSAPVLHTAPEGSTGTLAQAPQGENSPQPVELLPGRRRSFRNASPLPTRTLSALKSDPSLENGIDWVLEGILPKGALGLLYGIGKGGKSTFLSYLAAAIVSGRPFIEREVLEGPVLWIDLEQHISLTRETLLTAGAGGQRHEVHVYNGVAPGIDALELSVRQLAPVLVVVDSLSRLLQLRDENDAGQVQHALTPLLQLTRSTDTTVVAIHHDRKRPGDAGRDIRGSSVIPAMVDMWIGLKRETADDNKRRRLSIGGRYPGLEQSLAVTLTPKGYVALEETPPPSGGRVLEAIGAGSFTAEQLATRLGVTRTAVSNQLRELLATRRITRSGEGRRNSPYLYCAAASAEILSAPPEVI